MRPRSSPRLHGVRGGTLALLVGLGVWQMQRLAWKEGLIAEIEARTKAPPVSLEEAVARARRRDVSYLRVRAEGRFDHDKERYLFAIADGERRLARDHAAYDAGTGEVVLVDRGFVPDALQGRRHRGRKARSRVTVTVIGLARTPEIQGRFTPDNEPARNRWFWRDLPAMAASMFPGGERTRAVLPRRGKERCARRLAVGRPDRLDLPNDHLQYAITWFLLALCLVVIYVFYVAEQPLRRSA